MIIGKIYYLSTMLDKLNVLFFVLRIVLFVVCCIFTACFLDSSVASSEDDIKRYGKSLRISGIALVIVIILSIVTPNKEDFLIISMTKDYTTQQVYKMTKDEIKDGIDYFVNQVNKVKKGY
jgi:hypothetical protein